MEKIILCLAIIFSVCFAQMSDNTEMDSIKVDIENLNINQNKMRSFVDSLSNVKNEILYESQKFYSDSFDKIQGSYHLFLAIISVLVAFSIGILALFNRNTTSGLKEKIENQIKKQQNLFYEELEKQKKEIEDKLKGELEEKLKKELEDILEKERKINQDNFNAAYKKIAESFYVLASDKLTDAIEGKKEEYKNEHWVGHFMNLAAFYFNLSRMSTFTGNEQIFINFVMKFTAKYKEKNIPMPDIKFFYHFLPFIEHSEKIHGVISDKVKIIYNELLGILDYNKVKEYIKNSDFGEERIQKILMLAERYRNKAYLEKLGIIKV